jgi:hypothetical protein
MCILRPTNLTCLKRRGHHQATSPLADPRNCHLVDVDTPMPLQHVAFAHRGHPPDDLHSFDLVQVPAVGTMIMAIT